MKKNKKTRIVNKSICIPPESEIGRYCYSTFDKTNYKYIDRESKQSYNFVVMSYLQVFLSITSFVVIVHFCISLFLLLGILSDNKIDTFGVLQTEDISYSLANTNIRFSLVLSLLFLAVTYIVALFYMFWDTWKSSKLKGLQRMVLFFIYTIVIAGLVCILVYFLCEIYRYTYLLITFIIILILVFYMFNTYYKEPVKLISGLIVSFTVSVIVFFLCICYISSTSTTQIESQIEIELIDSSFIRSDSTRSLIYFGQKYVIFKNDSVGTELVPTSQIKGVKYSQKTVSVK